MRSISCSALCLATVIPACGADLDATAALENQTQAAHRSPATGVILRRGQGNETAWHAVAGVTLWGNQHTGITAATPFPLGVDPASYVVSLHDERGDVVWKPVRAIYRHPESCVTFSSEGDDGPRCEQSSFTNDVAVVTLPDDMPESFAPAALATSLPKDIVRSDPGYVSYKLADAELARLPTYQVPASAGEPKTVPGEAVSIPVARVDDMFSQYRQAGVLSGPVLQLAGARTLPLPGTGLFATWAVACEQRRLGDLLAMSVRPLDSARSAVSEIPWLPYHESVLQCLSQRGDALACFWASAALHELRARGTLDDLMPSARHVRIQAVDQLMEPLRPVSRRELALLVVRFLRLQPTGASERYLGSRESLMAWYEDPDGVLPTAADHGFITLRPPFVWSGDGPGSVTLHAPDDKDLQSWWRTGSKFPLLRLEAFGLFANGLGLARNAANAPLTADAMATVAFAPTTLETSYRDTRTIRSERDKLAAPFPNHRGVLAPMVPPRVAAVADRVNTFQRLLPVYPYTTEVTSKAPLRPDDMFTFADAVFTLYRILCHDPEDFGFPAGQWQKVASCQGDEWVAR